MSSSLSVSWIRLISGRKIYGSFGSSFEIRDLKQDEADRVFPSWGSLLGDMVFGDKQTLLEREGMRELQVLRCVCVVDRDREVLGNLTYY